MRDLVYHQKRVLACGNKNELSWLEHKRRLICPSNVEDRFGDFFDRSAFYNVLDCMKAAAIYWGRNRDKIKNVNN